MAALTITHPYVSNIPDAGDSSLVQPSNWNEAHVAVGDATATTGYVLVAQGSGQPPAWSNSPSIFITFPDGNVGAPGVAFTAQPATGLYRIGSGNVGLSLAGTLYYNFNTTSLSPGANDQVPLGTGASAWADLFLATGAVVNFGNGNLTLTHAASTLTMAGGTLVLPATGLQIGLSNPFSDSAGTLTLRNVDALDATTEGTIEAAIDTLPNLVNIQGRVVTLADAGADSLFGWDDSSSAYQNLSAADVRTIIDVRTKLTSDTTYNIPGDFSTLSSAVSYLSASVDGGDHNVTIQFANGTYSEAVFFVRPFVGIKTLLIQGNLADNTLVTLASSSGGSIFQMQEPNNTIVHIRSLTVDVTGTAPAIGVFHSSVLMLTDLYWMGSSGNNIAIGTSDFVKTNIFGHHYVEALGGTTSTWFYFGDLSTVSVEPSATIEIVGTPQFSSFFVVQGGGYLSTEGATFVNGASATGGQYAVFTGGIINLLSTTGQLPGNSSFNDGTGIVRDASGVIISNILSASGLFSGFMRVGSQSFPNNTTAGDITGVRLSLGNTAFSAANGLFSNLVGSITGTSGTIYGSLNTLSLAPSGASTADYRCFAVVCDANTAQNLSGTMAAGYFENKISSAGTYATSYGIRTLGLNVPSTTTVLGGVGNAIGAEFKGLSSVGNALSVTVFNVVAVDILTLTNSGSGPLTVASQAGLRVAEQTGATDNTDILIGTGTIPSGNYAVYSASTRLSYFAGAITTNGALTINAAVMIATTTPFTNGAAAAAGTLGNAPAAGNPTKWIPVNDNGTTRYIPAW